MKTKITIVSLVLLNAVLGTLLYQARHNSKGVAVFADHIQRLDIDIAHGGLLNVTLGNVTARQPVTSTVVLTPHAAIQLQAEMMRLFALVKQEAAAGRPPNPSVVPRSSDQSL